MVYRYVLLLVACCKLDVNIKYPIYHSLSYYVMSPRNLRHKRMTDTQRFGIFILPKIRTKIASICILHCSLRNHQHKKHSTQNTKRPICCVYV